MFIVSVSSFWFSTSLFGERCGSGLGKEVMLGLDGSMLSLALFLGWRLGWLRICRFLCGGRGLVGRAQAPVKSGDLV